MATVAGHEAGTLERVAQKIDVDLTPRPHGHVGDRGVGALYCQRLQITTRDIETGEVLGLTEHPPGPPPHEVRRAYN